MALPFIRRALHDAQIAGLQAQADRANMEKRQIGAALNEALKERDEARAIVAKAYVRGPGGRFQPATLPTPPETNA